jgi:GMP synthase (glutamine-hydrolysing)
MPHLAVIDPGTRVPELDCFNRISQASPLSATYHLPAQWGIDSLVRQPDVAGVVLLGSGASVHDGEPWQDALNGWLSERLSTLPMLGLCYGHQLLAHLLGGEIGFVADDQEKLRGVREVPLDADDLWGDARRVPLVISHREHVVRTPPGCVNLGHSDQVPVEAFRHAEHPIWGIQAHPEATTAFTTGNGIPFDRDPAMLAGGHALVDAFTAFVARRHA